MGTMSQTWGVKGSKGWECWLLGRGSAESRVCTVVERVVASRGLPGRVFRVRNVVERVLPPDRLLSRRS